MTSLVAKTIITNKFWVVENNGSQVATIQAAAGGVVYVNKDELRENFVSIKLLKDKYNITFSKAKERKIPMVSSNSVDGYPCDSVPYNALLNVSKKLPVYTKTEKSKSLYAAGHYVVTVNLSIVILYCPKLITLNRYEFIGPFVTQKKAKEYLISEIDQ